MPISPGTVPPWPVRASASTRPSQALEWEGQRELSRNATMAPGYLDGAGSGQRGAIEDHLKSCARARHTGQQAVQSAIRGSRLYAPAPIARQRIGARAAAGRYVGAGRTIRWRGTVSHSRSPVSPFWRGPRLPGWPAADDRLAMEVLNSHLRAADRSPDRRGLVRPSHGQASSRAGFLTDGRRSGRQDIRWPAGGGLPRAGRWRRWCINTSAIPSICSAGRRRRRAIHQPRSRYARAITRSTGRRPG